MQPIKLLISLFLCWQAHALIVVTDRGSDTATGNQAQVNFTNTTGDSIIAFISYNTAVEGGGLQVSFTGGGGGNLTCGTEVSGTGITTNICYIHNTVAGITNVLFDSNNEVRLNLSVITISGLNNAAPEDSNPNTGLASDTVTTDVVTPISASNLMVAVGAWTANDYSTGPTNGFTRLTPTGGGAVFHETAYLIQLTAATNSTGYKLTLGINWATDINVFGAPAAASSARHGKKAIL